MPRIPYRKVPGKIVAGAALVALLGSPFAAQLAVEQVAEFEGYVPQAYQDPVGIWTKCWGDTYDVTPGASYTFDQCVRSLNRQVLAHAKPVMECVPELEHQDDLVKAAFVSMVFAKAPWPARPTPVTGAGPVNVSPRSTRPQVARNCPAWSSVVNTRVRCVCVASTGRAGKCGHF